MSAGAPPHAHPASGRRPELARARRLAALLRAREVHLLLVMDPVNLRYLTGFTGTNGLALAPAEPDAPGDGHGHGAWRFLTDFRYATQSAAQVPETFERHVVPVNLLEGAAELLDAAPGGRLGFEEGALTVKQHTRLHELVGERWELVPCGGLVEELREVKEVEEVRRIRAAAALADEALQALLEAGLVGRTEREVALDLEVRMRRLGAQAPSFPTIVAAGPHSALPHAEPREGPIPPDTLVTIDWGALLDGYCSDCTRTYATGERLPEQAREVHALVLEAQLAGLAAVRPGLDGKAIDAAAREVIERAGHGEHFGHGLGHGVGLEVHEAPRLARTASEEPLRAGQVVTVEPGVYLPERFGVRIEDLVVLTEEGCERLSGLPKELTVVP